MLLLIVHSVKADAALLPTFFEFHAGYRFLEGWVRLFGVVFRGGRGMTAAVGVTVLDDL